MKKILSIIGILFLVSLMFVPLVSATYVCPGAATSAITNYDSITSSTTSGQNILAQCFTANATAYIYNVTFNLYKVGSPTGYLQAILYPIANGVVGTNAYPDHTTELDASTTILDSATLPGTAALFTFNFLGTYEVTNGTTYAIALKAYNGTFTVANAARMTRSGTDTYATQNNARYNVATWYTTAYDRYFILNGDTDSTSATPTPTPAPTGSGSGDADIENLTAIILPWLVPLLICLIPALLGYKFVGELGFFIGLNVGCILAYVTLAGTAYAFPLWGIILVGVMDVAVVLMRR